MKKDNLNKNISIPKKIGIDILGVALVICSILFGWLPGPGGIPLLLAGLSLLATNHEWARKLLNYVKVNGVKIIDLVFRDHPLLALFFDILAISLLIISGIYLGRATGNLWQGLAIILIIAGVSILLLNKKRIYKLNQWVNNIKHRNKP